MKGLSLFFIKKDWMELWGTWEWNELVFEKDVRRYCEKLMKTREVKSFDERMPKQGSFLQKKNFYFFKRRRRSQKQFQLMKCNENKIIKRLRNKDKNFSIWKWDAKTRKNKRKTTISYICIERAQCYKIRSFFEISATQFFI